MSHSAAHLNQNAARVTAPISDEGKKKRVVELIQGTVCPQLALMIATSDMSVMPSRLKSALASYPKGPVGGSGY